MALVPQNAQTIWTFLRSHGLSQNATAGILGNIYQESGGNPQAGSLSSGYGLIQWTPGHNYFSGTANIQTQLNAILKYIAGNGSISDINKHASTPQAAALYFSQKYERPGIPMNPTRMQSAADVLKAAIAGKWSAGGAPTTGSHSGGSMASTPAQSHAPTSQTQPANATTTGLIPNPFPGGNLDPLNWPTSAANTAISALQQTFFNYLKRFGFIILGGILIVVGLIILAKPAAETTVKIAGKAAEAGAV